VGKTGPQRRPGKSAGANSGRRGRITGARMPMSMLVTLLSRFERQTVVDRTNLQGPFELTLEWAPDDSGNSIDSNDRSGPSLFTAVQEQLGLKLESRKGPLDVLVVDRAEKVPVAN
jgi:uncharacterized protein (TIGR03435 family)